MIREESAAIYVADDLINENAQIAVYDPKVSKRKKY
jgi:UDPglucose 6-dehydrogenase